MGKNWLGREYPTPKKQAPVKDIPIQSTKPVSDNIATGMLKSIGVKGIGNLGKS